MLCPSTVDAPLHGGFVARDGRGDRDGSLAQPVNPAAIVEAHLEGGRHGQQPPSVLRLHQHPQPAGAGDVVGIAGDGKELVERRIADGELRAEHAVHPRSRAQNRLVRQHLLAAAHQGAVAARYDALLLAQDDMAAVRSSRHEEGQKLAVDPFDMDAPAVARADRLLVERLRDGGSGVVQQTSRRGRQGDIARASSPCWRLRRSRSGSGRRRSTPRDDRARRSRKTSTTLLGARRKRRGLRLQSRASVSN